MLAMYVYVCGDNWKQKLYIAALQNMIGVAGRQQIRK